MRDEVCGAMELGDLGAFGFPQEIQSGWEGTKERREWEGLAGTQWCLNQKCGSCSRAVESPKWVLSRGETNWGRVVSLHESLQALETPEVLASVTLIPNNYCILLEGLFSKLVWIKVLCLSVGVSSELRRVWTYIGGADMHMHNSDCVLCVSPL